MPKTTKEQDPSTAKQVVCYHCGLECPDDSISIGDKFFCCRGCRAVYRFLNESGFDRYYQVGESPGVKPEPDENGGRFAYLDDPALIERLSSRITGKRRRVCFTVPQIHCASCIWLLENLPRLEDGILISRVDFPRKELTAVIDDSRFSVRRLVELLARTGYEPQLNLGSVDDRPEPESHRSLYLKIGVAGFCFANVMLMSFPEYLASEAVNQRGLALTFRYLSLLLALPVLVYAASDYLRSAFFSLKQKRLNMDVPIALGMTVLFGRSAWEILGGFGAGYLDSLTGLTFFLLLGKLFQLKTYRHLSFERDYRSFFPVSAVRKRGDEETAVALDRLEVGDQIIVRNRELVPADAVLVDGDAHIDYSFVTGEAEPAELVVGQAVPAGGRQMGGAITLMLTKKVSQSDLVSLWNSRLYTEDSRPSHTNLAGRVAGWFTGAVVTIAAVAGVIWLRSDAGMAVNVVTSVLIVACPCALALAGPFAFGTALRLMGRDRFFLRNTESLERLASVDTILFDKTGTLTRAENRPIEFVGGPLSTHEERLVTALARNTSHPVGRQLARLRAEGETLAVRDFVEEIGQGMSASVDGHLVRVGRAEWVQPEKIASDGEPDPLHQEVWVQIDTEIRGHYRLSDAYREGLDESIRSLAGGYSLMVTSGDTDRERPRLETMFGPAAGFFFRQSPHDKLRQVKELTTAGKRVLMIGDGLNDSGALRAADVGVAVAEDGAGFTPASDGIMEASRLVRLPSYLAAVKRTVSVVRMAYGLSFVYNVLGLYFAVTGQLSPIVSAILMPASSVTVVLFAVLATRLQVGRFGI